MRNLILRSLGLTAMGALFAFATGSGVQTAEAVLCPCPTTYQVIYASGMAESCADALADLNVQLDVNNICPDGACAYDPIVITRDCYYNGMGGAWWKYDGYRRVRCRVCIEGPDTNP
jgi:hypothetical protein